MEQRTISSSQTFLIKVIFPTLLIVSVSHIVLNIRPNALNQTGIQIGAQFYLVFFILLIIILFILWSCVSLKRVRIDGTTMYISNYLNECAVPLSDIDRVSEQRWINTHPITVYFRSQTPFGDHIKFMPKIRIFGFFSSHPIVAELRQLSGQRESIETVKSTLRTWALCGLAVIGFFIILFAAVSTALKNSDAYQMTVRALNSDSEIVQILGQPISTGDPSGSINISGSDGKASLYFNVQGPKGSGMVYVKATKSLGQWKIDEAVLKDSKSGKRVDIAK